MAGARRRRFSFPADLATLNKAVELNSDDADLGLRRRTISLLPSLFTIAALAAGLSAIHYAADGRPVLALLLIGIAAVLDALDGRIARMLGASSKMGEQLDSLCDAVNFGVTPALVTYFTLFGQEATAVKNWTWMACVIYSAAIVLRLARFNTLLEEDDRPAFHKEFFVGVPAPAAALLALAPMVAHVQFGSGWWSSPVVASLWLVLVACLAFSKIPTLSMKTVRLRQRLIPALLAVFVVLVALLLTQPLMTVLILDLIYLAHLPFAMTTYLWLSSTPEAWEVTGRERRQIRTAGRKPRRRPRLRL
jgi:CDP-diacylglycerol--serine O-phosphatidyltransferase